MTSILQHHIYKIFNFLMCGECGIEDIIEATEYSRSSVYYALKIMREEGFVKKVKEGRRPHSKSVWQVTDAGMEHYSYVQMADTDDYSSSYEDIEEVFYSDEVA